jgi:5'-3' exonuclease
MIDRIDTEGQESTICLIDGDSLLYYEMDKPTLEQALIFVTTSETDAEKFLWKQVLMGDSTDNIQGIPGVGIKTAENWLKDREKEIEGFVLRKYVEKFGVVEGLEQFFINFRLVYLLKTKEDVLRETKLELPELQSLICINSKPEENEPTESAPESPPWETW